MSSFRLRRLGRTWEPFRRRPVRWLGRTGPSNVRYYVRRAPSRDRARFSERKADNEGGRRERGSRRMAVMAPHPDESDEVDGHVLPPRHDVPDGGRSGFLVSGGRQVHYLEWGARRSDRTVVMLHGAGQTAYMFEGMGAQLGEDYYVFAPDLPDHGDSVSLRGRPLDPRRPGQCRHRIGGGHGDRPRGIRRGLPRRHHLGRARRPASRSGGRHRADRRGAPDRGGGPAADPRILRRHRVVRIARRGG